MYYDILHVINILEDQDQDSQGSIFLFCDVLYCVLLSFVMYCDHYLQYLLCNYTLEFLYIIHWNQIVLRK